MIRPAILLALPMMTPLIPTFNVHSLYSCIEKSVCFIFNKDYLYRILEVFIHNAVRPETMYVVGASSVVIGLSEDKNIHAPCKTGDDRVVSHFQIRESWKKNDSIKRPFIEHSFKDRRVSPKRIEHPTGYTEQESRSQTEGTNKGRMRKSQQEK